MRISEDAYIPEEQIMLKELTHVCIVVRDVDATVRRLVQKFHIGPFTLRTVHTPESRGSVRGVPQAYSLRFAYARMGPVMLELVQPLDGTSLYSEYLEQHGEGVHHLGFPGRGRLDETLELWKKNDIEPLMVNRRPDARYGWAYMDTQDVAGCIFEVVCDPPLGWWDFDQLREEVSGHAPGDH